MAIVYKDTETIVTTAASGMSLYDGKLTTKQSVSNTPILVSTKTFTCVDNFYYRIKPTYTIKSQVTKRYSIIETNKVYDSANRLTSITFEIYFVFSNESVVDSDGDTIEFTSTPVVIITTPTPLDGDFIPKVREIALSTPLLGSGSTNRLVTVHADPGASFNFYIKNTAGEFYNFKGQFVAAGHYEKINIPIFSELTIGDNNPNQSVYQENIFFPRIYNGTEYTIGIQTLEDTVADGVKTFDTPTENIAKLVAPPPSQVPNNLEQVYEQPTILTLTFSVAHNITGTTYANITLPADYVIGPFEAFREVNKEYEFDFVITDAGAPFTLNQEASIEFGLDTDNLSTSVSGSPSWPHGENGNDFTNLIQGSTEAKGWVVDIHSAEVNPIAGGSFSISIRLTVSVVGTSSLTSQLLIDNFLSVL